MQPTTMPRRGAPKSGRKFVPCKAGGSSFSLKRKPDGFFFGGGFKDFFGGKTGEFTGRVIITLKKKYYIRDSI